MIIWLAWVNPAALSRHTNIDFEYGGLFRLRMSIADFDPIHVALLLNFKDILKLPLPIEKLIKPVGSLPDVTPLLLAVGFRLSKLCRLLLEQSYNPSYTAPPAINPLCVISGLGLNYNEPDDVYVPRLEAYIVHISKFWDLNEPDCRGSTPLGAAFSFYGANKDIYGPYKRDYVLLEYLLAHGARLCHIGGTETVVIPDAIAGKVDIGLRMTGSAKLWVQANPKYLEPFTSEIPPVKTMIDNIFVLYNEKT